MTERMKLLKCLAAADFAVYDTRLYLDTHPCDGAAKAAFCQYAERAKCLRRRYEELYGPLTVAAAAELACENGEVRESDCECSCKCKVGDAWLSDPWPWDCVVEGGR